MTCEEVKAIVLAFPGVEEGTSYGQPSFKAYGKFFTRLRRDDQSVVLSGVGFDEREMLMEAEPATFHFTAHYKDYPIVLAKIASLVCCPACTSKASMLLSHASRCESLISPK